MGIVKGFKDKRLQARYEKLRIRELTRAGLKEYMAFPKYYEQMAMALAAGHGLQRDERSRAWRIVS